MLPGLMWLLKNQKWHKFFQTFCTKRHILPGSENLKFSAEKQILFLTVQCNKSGTRLQFLIRGPKKPLICLIAKSCQRTIQYSCLSSPLGDQSLFLVINGTTNLYQRMYFLYIVLYRGGGTSGARKTMPPPKKKIHSGKENRSRKRQYIIVGPQYFWTFRRLCFTSKFCTYNGVVLWRILKMT